MFSLAIHQNCTGEASEQSQICSNIKEQNLDPFQTNEVWFRFLLNQTSQQVIFYIDSRSGTRCTYLWRKVKKQCLGIQINPRLSSKLKHHCCGSQGSFCCFIICICINTSQHYRRGKHEHCSKKKKKQNMSEKRNTLCILDVEITRSELR